eukprot:31434-Pelagococcus_subviridis.AAC.6
MKRPRRVLARASRWGRPRGGRRGRLRKKVVAPGKNKYDCVRCDLIARGTRAIARRLHRASPVRTRAIDTRGRGGGTARGR